MNCEKTRVKCIPSDHFAFKHWRNASISKGAKNAGSSTFELDHTWVDIAPSYGFVDETSIIAAEYHDLDDGEGNWSQREDEEGRHHDRIYYDPVRSREGENSTTTPLEPQASTPAVVDWNFSSISPNVEVVCSSGGYSASLYPQDVEHDSSSILPIDTPNSSGTTHQREDAAGQALLSMRNHDLGDPHFVQHVSPHSYSPMEASPSSRHPPSSVVSSMGTVLVQPAPAILTSKEEADLLRRFSAEVGTWMDLSDLSETFSKKVCRLAVHDPLLKAASMACAAKQLYLVGKLEDGLHIATTNYDIAISLLINRLREDLDEQSAEYGFAAIVICSCYEMLDAPTADWQRHLDGVFSFSRAQRVNGSSGGISQAAFWSIARQEVVCAIINRSKLRFDPELWLVDLENIGQEGSEDLVNNQVLTVLARVVNFVALSETYGPNKRIDEWQKLDDLLEHWSNSIKDTGFMAPVSVLNEEDKVFQTIWFARSVCASSWQMFHLARILLLTTNPLQDANCLLAFRKVEAQLSYHAREICGIAQSKPDGSCRVNSVQPIYYAGCCFHREDERKAAVGLLEDIENELGWAAIYRARDLYTIWGTNPG